MTSITWGNLFPLIVFIVSAGLSIFARFKNWKIFDIPESQGEIPISPENREASFFSRYRWEIILTLVLISILIFTLVFAPPRLTGEIPPNPNQPGRPFYSLHWLRDYYRDNTDPISSWSNLLASLFPFHLIVTAIKRRSRLHAEVALLFSSLTLAMLAQWTLGKGDVPSIGVVLYIISITGFSYWAWLARHRISLYSTSSNINPGREILLVFILLILTSYARFYALGEVPYGIEGDEAKWTSEAVNLSILGRPDTSGEYHRDALPVSFYLQTPFHRFFGASLLSARWTVAFLSVIATLIFYWLLRQIASVPIAAVGTYLLAVSIFDISASRLANVESFVKLWAVLPVALLALAIQKRVWPVFTLVGLSLALAALTYDTLWPILLVCFSMAIIDLWNRPLKDKYKLLSALIAPTLVVLPISIPYFSSRINYYSLGDKNWGSEWFLTLGNNFVNVLESWFVILRPDFLYNRAGPLLNSALLPLVVGGTIVALFSLQERVSRWLIIWTGMVILPVPIVTNSPLGRVYYPALPAIYGLIAVGLYAFWKELLRSIAPTFKPFLTALLLIPLVWLPLTNLYIYFNEVPEPDDRRMRREISDIAATVMDDKTLLILPVIPHADEPLNNEFQMIELFLMENLPEAKAKKAYQQIAIEDVLPAVSNGFVAREKLVIVLDNKTEGGKEQREALRNGLINCYPSAELIKGFYFDRLILSESSRRDARCISVALNLELESLTQFSWHLSNGSASAYTLLCDKQQWTYIWVEAEEMSISPGWQLEINFASNWSGKGFLLDTYGSQFLGYEIAPGFTGQDLYVWARTYKRIVDNSPAYMNVNGTNQIFGNTGEISLNRWMWELLGPFPNKEINRITITRPYNENLRDFMSLFLDAFVFTNDPSFSPDDELTKPLPSRSFIVSPAASSGKLQLILPPGQYSCRIRLETGGNLVDKFGHKPVFSNTVKLTIP